MNSYGEYHDLYVQSDTLLLADVFENFRDGWINKYKLDPAHFLSVPELAWQACLKKKTGVKLASLTDNDMLMMVEKGIKEGMCHVIYRYVKRVKGNNKYMKNYDKSIESSCLEYLDMNNFYGSAMSLKVPVDGF